MSLILLEALGALVLFVFIVWWTMFAGRDRGERRDAAGGGERRDAGHGGVRRDGDPSRE